MSSSLMRADCRKFTPNIFNKTKCTNCFRQKEEHSAEALELNKATRKISKCGYLFVAPGWDFSNPINRTKRWQRRWFVLYDDGELSYSLDEHPDTVPQASIDMNKVVEVSDAEEITGNPFSIAIAATDGVHFVKGTCREESKWWKDILSVFPRSKGRHKRNATFPGSQTSSALPHSSLSCRSSPDTRPRFNSIHTDSIVLLHPPSSKWLDVKDEMYPIRDISISVEPPKSLLPGCGGETEYTSDSHSESEKSYNNRSTVPLSPPTRDKLNSEERPRSRRKFSREKRISKIDNSLPEEVFCSPKSDEIFGDELMSIKNNRYINQSLSNIMREGSSDDNEVARRILFETEKSKREEKLKDIADSLTSPRLCRQPKTEFQCLKRRSVNQIKPTRDTECSDDEKHSVEAESMDHGLEGDEVDSTREKLVRGDPDGCGLDLSLNRYSPSSELRVDLPSEDILNIKKGWLLKQGEGLEWVKHWFVLRGVALMYYRDTTAEDKGILDGVLDLSSVKSVSEVQVQRNYGFQAVSWDDKKYILSAATAGIRSNWISALRKAAGLIEPIELTSLNLNCNIKQDVSHLDRESPQFYEKSPPSSRNFYLNSRSQRSGNGKFMNSPCVTIDQFENTCHSPSVLSRSSSNQYVGGLLRKSASLNFNDKQEIKRSSSAHSLLPEFRKGISKNSSRKDESDWGKDHTPLPPSPPLNRTPISRVKERAKTQVTKSRVYNKRSKSSPPSSRKGTVEVIHLDENFAPEEKRDEPIKRSTILDKVDRHVKEIDELKGQLNLALCERSSAEVELSRLKQRKSEANQQVEELIKSLKVAEEELKVKTQELENFENLKQRYSALVTEHEGMLKSWRESAINDGWRAMYQQLKDEYVSDKEFWEKKLTDVTSMLHVSTERCETLSRELASKEETVKALKAELTNLSERLMRGLEENEGLYGRMRELEGRCFSSSRERGRSVDSLSDLTNIDLDIDLDSLDKERIIEEYEELKGRFEKAVQEIRAMKKELRESHANYDELELTVINLRQDSKRREENTKSQAALMASRIEDLTLKLTASEKQYRILKQKIGKSESREKRRSLSLKGKESFYIGKETEEKLAVLEEKLNALESGKPISSISNNTRLPETENKGDVKSSRLRRKSLESVASTEPMKILLRMFSLERKIAKVAETLNFQFKEEQIPRTLINEKHQEVSEIFKKLQGCISILTAFRDKNPGSFKSLLSLEEWLKDLETLLTKFTDPVLTCFTSDSLRVKRSADFLVHKLENLLKSKWVELSDRKQELLEKGRFDQEAKLRLMAEKLAYESVLVKKIREVVLEDSQESESWKNSINLCEIQEIGAILFLLKRKVESENVRLTGNCLNDLSKAAADRIFLEGEAMTNSEKSLKTLLEDIELNLDYEKLIEKQKEIVTMVAAYKNYKIEQISKFLAFESIFTMDDHKSTRGQDIKENKRLMEARCLAQEALNKEVVQAEISHIAMRCLLMFENGITKEQEGKLTFIAEKFKRQEDYLQKIDESLRIIMDKIIVELTSEYEKRLKIMKKDKMANANANENFKEDGKKCRQAMEDLFSVLSVMEIINVRLDLLTKKPEKLSVKNDGPVVRGVYLKSHLADPSLETRFVYLYQKFSAECSQRAEYSVISSALDVSDVEKLLMNCTSQVNYLREMLSLPAYSVDDAQDCSSVKNKCYCLCSNLKDIVEYMKEEFSCSQCCVLKEALHKFESHYDEDINNLKESHEKEIQSLREELETQKKSLMCQHELEQAQLIEKTRRLEKRLGTLDAEYSQQINNLRLAYHKTLSADLEGKEENSEDSIRQRYQAEIEQLRTLCEKGLIAIDSSHRRIIAELEEKHRQDLAAAAAEKEQALAEETQATLAALDAMRKAHESEVQKEINKFKTEFLKKMESSHDSGGLHKEHEAEMEEIKKEILSLSEKYTVKCVESASLEEQLSHVSKQLTKAQEHISQLDARNKQLRAHLVSETRDFEDFKGGHNENISGKKMSPRNSQKCGKKLGSNQ